MTEFVTTLLGLLLVGVMLVGCSHARADGFRIDTDVLVGERKEPVQQTVTLFQDGVAYDTSRDDDEITLVDPARNRIVLLNPTLKIKTEIAISELTRLIGSARSQVEAPRLLGASKVNASTERVSVGDSQLKYVATIQAPPSSEMADEYRKFADALAQLNSWSPSGAPPYTRLALNEAVQKQNAIPVRIVRTMNTVVVECHLHSTWILSTADKSRIADISKKLISYKQVATAKYFDRKNPKEVAAKPGKNQAR